METKLAQVLSIPLSLRFVVGKLCPPSSQFTGAPTCSWGAVTLCHLDDLPFGKQCGKLPAVFTTVRGCLLIARLLSSSPLSHSVPQARGRGSPGPPVYCRCQRASTAAGRGGRGGWGAAPAAGAVSRRGCSRGPLAGRGWSRNGRLSLTATQTCLYHQVMDFQGGETAGRRRLQYYLWDSNLISTYKNTRNGLLGGARGNKSKRCTPRLSTILGDYSSKFSPWLAHGCITARWIYHEVRLIEVGSCITFTPLTSPPPPH